jgi:hypothetical protein
MIEAVRNLRARHLVRGRGQGGDVRSARILGRDDLGVLEASGLADVVIARRPARDRPRPVRGRGTSWRGRAAGQPAALARLIDRQSARA